MVRGLDACPCRLTRVLPESARMSTDALLQRKFLAALHYLLQPPLPGDPPPDPNLFDRLPQPNMVGELRGNVCRFEFVADDELLIALQVRPTAHLVLRHEERISRFLDKLGLSPEVKIGDPDFDSRYLVQKITQKDARALLNRKIRPLVEGLEPFFAIEMAERELRLLKFVELKGGQGYKPADAVEDLERLLVFHYETRAIDLPDAGR